MRTDPTQIYARCLRGKRESTMKIKFKFVSSSRTIEIALSFQIFRRKLNKMQTSKFAKTAAERFNKLAKRLFEEEQTEH